MNSSAIYEIILDTREVNAEAIFCLSLIKIDKKILPRLGGRKMWTGFICQK
jgi:hypothetical protein